MKRTIIIIVMMNKNEDIVDIIDTGSEKSIYLIQNKKIWLTFSKLIRLANKNGTSWDVKNTIDHFHNNFDFKLKYHISNLYFFKWKLVSYLFDIILPFIRIKVDSQRNRYKLK